MNTQKANIDGVDIAYDRLGKGKTMVLIHGFPLTRAIWDSAAPLLADDFDLLIPDLRGFGDSGMMEADQSIIDYASDVAELLNHLKIRKAFVVGHSMGGYVALAMAREFPTNLSGLGLVSSQVAADTPDKKQGRREMAEQLSVSGVEPVAESLSRKLAQDATLQSEMRAMIMRQKPEALRTAVYAMADRLDSTDLFAALEIPVVVVHGDADALIPVERGREMKAALPGAHYAELHGVGHMPMLEDPRSVADALKSFLKAEGRAVKLL